MQEGIARFLSDNVTAYQGNATSFLKMCADNIGLCWGLTLGGSLAVGAGLATVATCAFFKFRNSRRLQYTDLVEREASAFGTVPGGSATENSALVVNGGGASGGTPPRMGSVPGSVSTL